MRKKQKKLAKDIAKERVMRYFELADKTFSRSKSLSNRYVTLARKTAMKYQIPISKEHKRMFCKNCYKFIRPGANLRVRTTKKGNLSCRCMECNKIFRIPFKTGLQKVKNRS